MPGVPKWFVRGDRVTAVKAAKAYGLDPHALTAAIDAGTVRAVRIETGSRSSRFVDLGELEEDLAGLPRCAFVSKAGVPCERPALKPGSVACSGPHARGIETRGRSWRTQEAIEKGNAAKRGKPR